MHFIGADTLTLWSAILTSCNTMVTSNLGERFALLDVPRLTAVDMDSVTTAEETTYRDAIAALIPTVADNNAVICTGEAKFISSDGTEYWNRITSDVSGRIAANKIQESLLAKTVPNISAIAPVWGIGSQTVLVTEHLIHMRLEPGLGLIFGNSDTRCPEGSAYNRIEKVRATYAAGKACRLAALPHLGRPNDSEGEGLLPMEADMRQPLNLMVQKGEIDSYDLELISTEEMRALGEVTAVIGVNSLKAFEIILEKVYLD